jgi:7,8-dihydro-6-hydroxymethylpterin dimethyltransferase
MESNEHSLYLRDGIVTQEEQRDLDKLGIAKNAREEKIRARDAKQKEARGPQKNDAAYDARMAALYREVVLKEKPVQSEGGFISLDALVKPNGNGNGHSAPKPEVEETVAGD